MHPVSIIREELFCKAIPNPSQPIRSLIALY